MATFQIEMANAITQRSLNNGHNDTKDTILPKKSYYLCNALV